jgi:hypothetical protein
MQMKEKRKRRMHQIRNLLSLNLNSFNFRILNSILKEWKEKVVNTGNKARSKHNRLTKN